MRLKSHTDSNRWQKSFWFRLQSIQPTCCSRRISYRTHVDPDHLRTNLRRRQLITVPTGWKYPGLWWQQKGLARNSECLNLQSNSLATFKSGNRNQH
jgi:hypothetical protein